MASTIHPFERAKLGMAPFRCVGWYESKYQACHGAPIQPGSSCDYCGQGIMLVFRITSSDGKEFKVGCDCVAKTARECAGTDAERAARKVLDQVNKIKTAAANKRKDAVIAAARAKLEANRASLAERTIATGSRVHPARTYERNALEYFDWMFKYSGRTGKLKAAKQLEDLLTQPS